MIEIMLTPCQSGIFFDFRPICLLFKFPPYSTERNFQRIRQLLGNSNAHLHLAAFDGTDVCAVNADNIGKRFLGYSQLFAMPPDSQTKPDFDVFLHNGLALPTADDYSTD